MTFIGKSTFAQGGNFVQADLSDGKLSLGPVPADGGARLNAYGAVTSFTIQAANGRYLVWDGSNYATTGAADGQVNRFALDTVDADTVRLLDLGVGVGGNSPAQFYWNVTGTVLGRASKDAGTPPESTVFTRAIVTAGIETILQEGFRPTPSAASPSRDRRPGAGP